MMHCLIKGTISDRTYQTSLFSKPQIFFFFFFFWHFQRELHRNSLPRYNNSLENSIFLERETIFVVGN